MSVLTTKECEAIRNDTHISTSEYRKLAPKMLDTIAALESRITADQKYRDNCGICGERRHNENCRVRELESRNAELEGVLRDLLAGMDLAEPYIQPICRVAELHGVKYLGPDYGEQLRLARAVLANQAEQKGGV